ncbi:MAG: hypothetical protein WCE45_06870 [Sedimentisphaerales bacterium]
MKNENLPEESKPKQESFEERKISADDLKFMRSVVEKTYRQVRPDVHIMVACGLICIIAYAALYFLKIHQLDKWIWPMGLSMISIILCYIVICLVRIAKYEKKAGFISHLKRQLTRVWIFITLQGLVFTILAMLFNDYSGGDPPFIWAMLFSIGLCVLGVFHSKEWLWGAILIFAGMILTYFVEESAYIILGLTMGAGFIIPAIIADRNYRKQEKENE